MSMLLKGCLAAVLLAVAPMTMALPYDVLQTVVVNGDVETFHFDVDDGVIAPATEYVIALNFVDHMNNVVNEGHVDTQVTSYNVALADFQLVSEDGAVLAHDNTGVLDDNGLVSGYTFDLSWVLAPQTQYYLRFLAPAGSQVSVAVDGAIGAAVPLPGAALLFGTALFGAGVYRRRKGEVAGADAIAA